MYRKRKKESAGFSRAARYPGPAWTPGDRVRDTTVGFPLDPPTSERLLQAVWYDPSLRPDPLNTTDGESVRVEHPGEWNLGPGPDFLGAVVRIGPDQRRIRGDVEVHIRPSGWTAHGHADDPRYRQVRFHVTFAPAPTPRAPLPPGTLRIALRDRLAADPGFSFESVDSSAYPFAVRRGPCPCAAVLKGGSPDACGQLLEAAGEERLRRKTERLRRIIEERGEEQAGYEEIMSALGYRHNKTPFRRLAVSVPLAALREEAAGSPRVAHALLTGVAGLLPATARPDWDAETREELRAAWDAWWKRRRRWERFQIPSHAWRLAGIRPANHPIRRLQAAAFWMTRPTPLHTVLQQAAHTPATLVPTALAWLETPPEGYWSRRLTWGGPPQSHPRALVGKGRAAALLINVITPYLVAIGAIAPDKTWLDALPAEAANEHIRRAAHALFGPDHSPTLYRSGLRRQGLLQIFHDYCLADRTACADCPFPGYLAPK